MTKKSIESKAILIKGKKYIQVKDRIIHFNENYKHGKIETRVLSDDDKRVVIKAKVTPDIGEPTRYFTGISASNPSKSIEAQVPHEVAETSAVGRALGMMGIGVIDSVASVDEMSKAGAYKPTKKDLKMDDALEEAIDKVSDKTENAEDKKCPTCGKEMTYKTGTSKSGHAWKGWFCDCGQKPVWEK